MSVKIFCCYAHEDSALHDELEKHLSVLKLSGRISLWDDREIQPGADWKQEIGLQLNSANIILLLISSDFLASNFCYSVEMQTAFNQHKSKNVYIIPVILRPVVWETTPIGQLQALPKEGKPITLWTNRDEAFKDVVLGISQVINIFTAEEEVKEWIDEGNAHYYAGHYKKALAYYNRVINYHNRNFIEPIIFFMRLASEYNEQDNNLPKMAQSAPFGYSHDDLLTKIGSALWHDRHYQEALVAFEQAISLNPHNSLAHIGKGLVLEGLGRSKEAKLHFKSAQEYT